jgi:hypothetical protein
MKIYSQKYREGEPGAGGAAAPTAAEIAKQIQDAVDAATSGLKATNAALKAEKQVLVDKAKAFDGLDVEELKSFHAQFKDSEDLKLIKDGKIDEVLSRRNAKFLEDAGKQAKVAQDALEAEKAKNGKFAQRVLNDSIRAAASDTGTYQTAGVLEDVLLNAALVFALDDEGRPVQLKDGEVVLGKDGKTPFSPREWIESKREAKVHWFPSGNSGSPAGDGAGGSGGGKTIRRAAFDALPATERAKVAVSHRIVD